MRKTIRRGLPTEVVGMGRPAGSRTQIVEWSFSHAASTKCKVVAFFGRYRYLVFVPSTIALVIIKHSKRDITELIGRLRIAFPS